MISKRLTIACDGDGVVADLHVEWFRRYNHDYNDTLTLDRVLGWDVHNYVKPECGTLIYKYLQDPDLYDAVPVIQDAAAGIAILRAAGHKVIFATACEYGMTDQKARWFERAGLVTPRQGGRSLPDQFIPINDKTMLGADLLIDDGARQIEAWIATGRNAFLYVAPHNRGFRAENTSPLWRPMYHWQDIVTALI